METGWTENEAQATGPDTMDEKNHLAKVRVAGSNPVVRSKRKSRSEAPYSWTSATDPARCSTRVLYEPSALHCESSVVCLTLAQAPVSHCSVRLRLLSRRSVTTWVGFRHPVAHTAALSVPYAGGRSIIWRPFGHFVTTVTSEK